MAGSGEEQERVAARSPRLTGLLAGLFGPYWLVAYWRIVRDARARAQRAGESRLGPSPAVSVVLVSLGALLVVPPFWSLARTARLVGARAAIPIVLLAATIMLQLAATVVGGRAGVVLFVASLAAFGAIVGWLRGRIPRVVDGSRFVTAGAIAIGAVLLPFVVLVGGGGLAAFRMPSGSMEPTLRCGDRFLVDRVTSRAARPERFDVVVFHPPGEAGDPAMVATTSNRDGTRSVTPADTVYVKRVVGLPGEQVEVRDHLAYVDGEQLDEPFALVSSPDAVDGAATRADWGPQTVPDGTYLLLGDHRDNSADGRVFGYVPEQFIIGRVAALYWPPERIGRIPDVVADATAHRADPACLESAPPLP